MKRATIREMVQVGRDLVSKRAEHLALLASGPVYRRLIDGILARLEAMPEALAERPQAALIKELDETHDALWRSVVTFRELLEGWHQPTPAITEALGRLKLHFGEGRAETNAPYLVEAERAERRAKWLTEDQAVFEAVPGPDGQSLAHLLGRYVEAGRAIGAALSGRADELAARGDASEAGLLRGKLIGALEDLRVAIRRELEVSPELPRNLEALILGLYDEATRLAEARTPSTPAAPKA